MPSVGTLGPLSPVVRHKPTLDRVLWPPMVASGLLLLRWRSQPAMWVPSIPLTEPPTPYCPATLHSASLPCLCSPAHPHIFFPIHSSIQPSTSPSPAYPPGPFLYAFILLCHPFPSPHLSTHTSVLPSMCLPTDPLTNPSAYPSVHPSIHPLSVHLLMYSPTHPAGSPLLIHLFIYLPSSICPPSLSPVS